MLTSLKLRVGATGARPHIRVALCQGSCALAITTGRDWSFAGTFGSFIPTDQRKKCCFAAW